MVRDTVMETNLSGLKLMSRGKVRDVYELDDRLLIVATDRISAFDYVMPTPIPDKGRILSTLSEFWFKKVEAVTPHHFLGTDITSEPSLQAVAEMIEGRSMVVQRAEVIPIEFVPRGYIFGTAYDEYRVTGTACGIKLPVGLRLAERLPEPILTPATKSSTGHDINITHQQAMEIAGEEVFVEAMKRSLQLYELASRWLEPRGILLCDTKFEFGFVNGKLILVDEILTPDSARFWPAESYRVGENPLSFDKQFLRNYLVESGWNRLPPAPSLPDDIVQQTRQRYYDAYFRITGKQFE